MIEDTHTRRAGWAARFGRMLARPAAGSFAVAVAVRWAALPWIEFKGDEAGNCELALQALARGSLPFGGIGSSLGNVNPPLFVMLLMLPLSVSAWPPLAAGLVALIDSLGAACCAAAARSVGAGSPSGAERPCHNGGRVGAAAAWIAGLTYATNPWMVLHGRKLWQQGLLAAFSALALWALLRLWRATEDGPADGGGILETKGFTTAGYPAERRRKARAGFLAATACAAVLCTLQVHLSGALLVPVAAVAVAMAWRGATGGARRAVAAGCGAGILVGMAPPLPFLLADQAQGWRNLGIIAAGAPVPGGARTHPEVAAHALRLLTGSGFPAGAQVPLAGWLMLPLVAAGAAAAWRTDRRVTALLLAWMLAAPLLVLFHRREVYPHYLPTMLPPAGVLAGLAACVPDTARCRGVRLGRLAALAAAVVLGAFAVHDTLFAARIYAAPGVVEWNGYGTPYATLETQVRAAMELGAQSPMAATALIRDMNTRRGVIPDTRTGADVYREAVEYITRHRIPGNPVGRPPSPPRPQGPPIRLP